ncbi:MAG TPA: hypothetical protein VJN94_01525 [Candidatus Binataceae bacterium]|nr:hypothetical protein [Candidatus Binataceae bacterium]
MKIRNIVIYSLLFFCGSLLWSVSSASAQTCTPVVYAFRHAEDFGTNLTAVGHQHADLYINMLGAGGFGAVNDYCPVGYVYSMYNKNPNGTRGTDNPFETGRPLAIAVCTARGSCTGSEPAMRTALGKYLYEYLKISGAPPTTKPSASQADLRAELISHADEGFSTAIFWSSQGLNVLGRAIADTSVDIPGCSKLPPSGGCEDRKAPRNAAYVFEFNGTNGFDLVTPGNKYVECFDVQITKACKKGSLRATPPTLVGPPIIINDKTSYWCGNINAGNLPATTDLTKDCEQTLPSTFDNLHMLQAKICATEGLPEPSSTYYGYCQ